MAAYHTRIIFDEHDQKYMCCCGKCHLKRGVGLVGVFTLLLLGIEALLLTLSDTSSSLSVLNNVRLPLPYLTLLAAAVGVFMMLTGVYLERPKWMLPQIVTQVLMHAVITFQIVYILELMYEDVTRDESTAADIAVKVAIVPVLVLLLLLNCHCLRVLLKSYQFFIEKKKSHVASKSPIFISGKLFDLGNGWEHLSENHVL